MMQVSLLDQGQPQSHLQNLDEAEQAIHLCNYPQESQREKNIGPSLLLLIWCSVELRWCWWNQSIPLKTDKKDFKKAIPSVIF